MEEQKQSGLKNFLIYTTIILLGPAVSFGGCYLLEKPMDEIIRNMVVVIVCCLLIVLSLMASGEKKTLFFNNYEHLSRFFFSFLLGLVLSVCSVFSL